MVRSVSAAVISWKTPFDAPANSSSIRSSATSKPVTTSSLSLSAAWNPLLLRVRSSWPPALMSRFRSELAKSSEVNVTQSLPVLSITNVPNVPVGPKPFEKATSDASKIWITALASTLI